jgi:tetratricopeptide (TPR) repeat protein
MRKSDTTVQAFPQAAIYYVESLADRREYAAVVNYYENNRSEIEGPSGASTANCLRLIAMAYADLNNHSSALKTARLAQKKAAEEYDSILLGEIFVTMAGSLVQLGEYKEAEKAYRDAESIFRRCDNLEGQSRALNLLSGLFFKQSDFQNSLAALSEALVIAKITQKSINATQIAHHISNLFGII